MRRLAWKVGLSLILLGSIAMGPGAAADEGFRVSAPRFWWRNWAVPPWIALVGDADGDGRADLIAVDPSGEIEVERTSPLGKWVKDPDARKTFGKDFVAVACGRFTGGAEDEVLGLERDGSVRLAFGMHRGTSGYRADDRAGQIPAFTRPATLARAFSADIDRDGCVDVVIQRGPNQLVLLRNLRKDEGLVRFSASVAPDPAARAAEAGVGRFGPEAHTRLVWLDDQGNLSTAGLEVADGELHVGAAVTLLKANRGDRLAVGRFLGHATHDIIVGRRLLPGGDASRTIELPTLPNEAEAKHDLWWRVGDIDGNGMDDLVRKRSRTDREGGPEILIHFAARQGNVQPGFLDEDQDGLPDDWETGRIKPGGIDLRALGCKPGRSDVIVEIERFDKVDTRLLETEVDVTVRYFASLPVANPDGTRGIAMHPVYRPTTPHADFDNVIKRFDERYPPQAHRGVVHSMFCGAEGDPDFAVAGVMGGNGRFHLNRIVHDVMSHEFGHELGLTHEAFQPHNCPIYPSVMNYTYIEGPAHRLDLARYSEGALCSLVLNERHLSERLPFPLERVEFLSWTPYQYRLERSRDGRSVLIDWNWNGIFGEENVVADINYDHGTDFGPPRDVGRADSAPVLVTHGTPRDGRLLLLLGRGGGLRLREWLGSDVDKEGDRWSAEAVVEASGVLGDPTAVYLEGGTWVAYRTTDHVALRRIVPGGDHPTIGPALAVPASGGCEPTLASFGGHLALFLWRSPGQPIGLRVIDVKGREPAFGREEESNFASLVPVAAVEAHDPAAPALWVAMVEPNEPDRRSWSGVRRFVRTPEGRWHESRREWVDGEVAGRDGAKPFAIHAAHRPTLLWRSEPGFDARHGRLYHFSGGATTADRPWSEQYITMQTAARETGTNWLSRRYTQPEFTSRSAPGACWFRGDIAYAIRVHDNQGDRNDVVKLGFYGSGALPEPMSDYNDVAFIHRVGLSHSIPVLTPEAEAATPNFPGPVSR